MTEAKIVKQEIKEDNSTNTDEQNIAKIINLKELSKPMIDPPSLEKDVYNRQNFLSLSDRVIFQKQHTEITLVINKEFSLTEIALIDSGANMNCIQEGNPLTFQQHGKMNPFMGSSCLKRKNGSNQRERELVQLCASAG